MSVHCPGSEILCEAPARVPVRAFLRASFNGGGRFPERLKKVDALEREVWHGEL